MQELFTTPTRGSVPMSEDVELMTIAAAKMGDKDAQWALLWQYRGALQAAVRIVHNAARSLTSDQLDDLRSDLVLEALTVIADFDRERFGRLAQVLPRRLRHVAAEQTVNLVIPRGTLARWYRVLREAAGDVTLGADLAAGMGMQADTFRAIAAALDTSGSEWLTLPFDASRVSPDAETYDLAHRALATLTGPERTVVELAYGFAGDPKSDDEVALIRGVSKTTVKKQRHGALATMRRELTGETGSPDGEETSG